MEKFIIIVLIILIILMLSRIRIIINKEINSKIKIKLYLFPKLGININLDRFIKRYQKATFEERITYFNNDLQKMFMSKGLMFDLLKIIKFRKIQVIIAYDYIKYPNEYIYLSLINGLSFIKNFLDKHARCIESEHYDVDICQNKSSLYIYVDMIFPLVYLVLIGLKNIKIIIKGIIKHGTSNKRVVKTIR